VQRVYILLGTTLELHPEYLSGYFFIINTKRPNRKVSGPFDLKMAKQYAERLAPKYGTVEDECCNEDGSATDNLTT
jgi:hypothetical protein